MESKLFYLPRGSDDVAGMTDLSGRSYGRLPTAFAYRQSRDKACTCRPEPWTEAAVARHLSYAQNEVGSEPGVARETASLPEPAGDDADLAEPSSGSLGETEAEATADGPPRAQRRRYSGLSNRHYVPRSERPRCGLFSW